MCLLKPRLKYFICAFIKNVHILNILIIILCSLNSAGFDEDWQLLVECQIEADKLKEENLKKKQRLKVNKKQHAASKHHLTSVEIAFDKAK